ncbi:MAG: sigma-70 family RNA polymerase sigma factor [Deltaproteobacteria bacterium]|nr:sigma-70 family RNA polymerase sigma factor [Deltaproteobacteria bacterium]
MTSADKNDQDTKTARAAQNAKDLELVNRARSGDRQAFGKLVETYQRRVYAIAFGILRSREDAWDAAQEAFVKAYKNLDRFEGTSAFYTWMYRITYNLSIDHLREKKRRETTDLDENRRLEEALEDSGRKVSEHPDEMSGRKELSRVLHEAMDKLTDKHRAIIVLREVEGLSYEEMADVLGISKGTVMSRLFHARKNLQALLRPYVDAGEGVPESLQLAVSGAA